jgi:hypothetical protein
MGDFFFFGNTYLRQDVVAMATAAGGAGTRGSWRPTSGKTSHRWK